MSKCLICLSSPASNTKTGEDSSSNLSLEKEVDSFYLIRKLLGVSNEVCASLLEAHGSPSRWFSLCAQCHSSFHIEGKRVFDEIQRLTKLHNDIRHRALGRMRVKVESQEEDAEMEQMWTVMGTHDDDDTPGTTIRSHLLNTDKGPISSDSDRGVYFFDNDDGGLQREGEEQDNGFEINDDPPWAPLPPPAVKKGRGRPKKTKNKPKKTQPCPSPPPLSSDYESSEGDDANDDEEDEEEPRVNKTMGRPCGSTTNRTRLAERCFECRKNIVAESVEDHIRRLHTFPEARNCGGCGKSILKVSDYLEHVSKAKEEDPSSLCLSSALPCPLPDCGVFRGTYGAIAIHLKTAHYVWEPREKGRVYKCDLCPGKEYKSKNHRGNHLKVSHIDPVLQCDRPNCAAALRGKMRMMRHVHRVHLVEEKILPAFLCPDCGMQFKTKVNLDRHMKLHGEETPFICSECGKGYKVCAQLKRHMWSHDMDLDKEKRERYRQNVKNKKKDAGKAISRFSKLSEKKMEMNEMNSCGK